MNNRFKFRVWFAPDWQDPEMIYEAEHTYDNRCRNKGSFHHESFGEILEDKDCIVMQSTGLKDKNGKLIYEGDVVIYDWLTPIGKVWRTDGKHTVEWDDGFTVIGNIAGYDVEHGKTRNIEVIGNIYENKELLNENS